MCDRDGKMEGSQWVYMGTEKINITFIKALGRSIENVREYTKYPQHKHGATAVINLDYNHKPHHINVGETAECLLWTLKCHKLYLKIKDDEILRKDFVKDLTRNCCCL